MTIVSKQHRSAPQRTAGKGHGLLMAVTLVVIAILGFYSYQASRPVFEAHYHNQGDQQLHKTLPDGTQIKLAPSSSIRLKFYDRVRMAELQAGEVMIRLGADQAAPLQLAAGALRVQASEGQLLVRQAPTLTQIQVLAGSAQTLMGRWWPDRQDLQAGQQLQWSN